MIEVKGLIDPDYLIEIEATAVILNPLSPPSGGET
jgi:hypothetical protein